MHHASFNPPIILDREEVQRMYEAGSSLIERGSIIIRVSPQQVDQMYEYCYPEGAEFEDDHAERQTIYAVAQDGAMLIGNRLPGDNDGDGVWMTTLGMEVHGR